MVGLGEKLGSRPAALVWSALSERARSRIGWEGGGREDALWFEKLVNQGCEGDGEGMGAELTYECAAITVVQSTEV